MTNSLPISFDFDTWSVYNEIFDTELDFRKRLVSDLIEMSSESEEPRAAVDIEDDQDDVIFETDKIFIEIISEDIYAMVPIWASHPNDGDYDKKGDKWVLNRKPNQGITRGYLQWQISNVLAGLPLLDHRFPENLTLDKQVIKGKPVYKLFLGS